VNAKDVKAILHAPLGRNTVVTLDLEGTTSLAMLKSFDHHPLSREVTHADFYTVRLDRAVLVPVPFVLIGKSKGVAVDGGVLRNRAPIVSDGRELHQDKLNLTPWETGLRGGDTLHVWDFGGVRCAVIICLDIEVPELSVALRAKAVDLVLVPSATENILGVERVGRCADARAVELCCHVGLAHLVGDINSSLVDANVGRLGVFSPSQSTFGGSSRQRVSEIVSSGFHRLRAELDISSLRRQRDLALETNPARLRPGSIRVEG
jgi:predicted amidohydrolase